MRETFRDIVALIALLFAVWTFSAVMIHLHESDKPVCYAETEDSVITGCDYRNGGWYRK